MSIHFPSTNNAGLRARSSFTYGGDQITVFGWLKCVAAPTSSNWYRQLVAYRYSDAAQFFFGVRGDGAGQVRAVVQNSGASSVDVVQSSVPSQNVWVAVAARHRLSGDPKRVQLKLGSNSIVTGPDDLSYFPGNNPLNSILLQCDDAASNFGVETKWAHFGFYLGWWSDTNFSDFIGGANPLAMFPSDSNLIYWDGSSLTSTVGGITFDQVGAANATIDGDDNPAVDPPPSDDDTIVPLLMRRRQSILY